MTKNHTIFWKKTPLLTIFENIEWGSLECRVWVMHDHLLGVVTGQKYFTFLSATSVVKLFSLPLYSPARAKLSWEIGSLGFSILSFHTMIEILKFCPKIICLFFSF